MYCKTVCYNNQCATPKLIKNVRQECEDAELRQRMIKAIQEAKGELETQTLRSGNLRILRQDWGIGIGFSRDQRN